jgi:uncharacterized RDD family membrane protein YckC
VKCPKCSYLGFETGDRCKNCGYDFSLIAESPEPVAANDRFVIAEPSIAHVPAPAVAPDLSLRTSLDEGPALRDLPLFTPAVDPHSDEPLIKLPATPRPPLAVRRTPDMPRLRSMPKPRPRIEDLELFAPEPLPPAPVISLTPVPSIVADRAAGVWGDVEHRAPAIQREPSPFIAKADADAEVSHAGARAMAAAIDHLMLFGIDLAVLYFTLRMTGLTMGEWSALPALPFLAFLLFVKVSYFCAFTAVGGQTIGKMAAHIRVVADEEPLAGAVALKRTLAATVSTLLLGAGFIPALIGSDRRAIHDRLTRTRVIDLRSA